MSTSKLFKLFRTAVYSENPHSRLKELDLLNAHVRDCTRKSEEFMNSYILERGRKVAAIEEKVVAKSEDCEINEMEEFYKRLAKEKPGQGPNIDFFTQEELEEVIKKH